jgi:hypothetical protein
MTTVRGISFAVCRMNFDDGAAKRNCRGCFLPTLVSLIAVAAGVGMFFLSLLISTQGFQSFRSVDRLNCPSWIERVVGPVFRDPKRSQI